jgi:hypothetical protein
MLVLHALKRQTVTGVDREEGPVMELRGVKHTVHIRVYTHTYTHIYTHTCTHTP